MSNAICDPEAMRYFAGVLESLGADMRGRNLAVATQAISLGETWRDAKYRAFQQDFDETVQKLGFFLLDCEKYVDYLRVKARIIEEEYHR
jgi:hypothetical protein